MRRLSAQGGPRRPSEWALDGVSAPNNNNQDGSDPLPSGPPRGPSGPVPRAAPGHCDDELVTTRWLRGPRWLARWPRGALF
eukprot:8436092-Pyramimonas_sp.AAC.2